MVVVLLEIEEVRIGKDSGNFASTEAETARWGDSDPWVVLEIPAGGNVYQDLKPLRLEVTLTCADIASLYTALYETAINADGDFAINPATGKKTKIGYFVIKAKGHGGTTYTYTFTDARVRIISIGELGNLKMLWTVQLYADLVVKS